MVMFFILAVVGLFYGHKTGLSANGAFALLLMMCLLFISSICQVISIIFVYRRKYFSLAVGGAVFGIFFIPISFIIIGLLFHQRGLFDNPYDAPISFDPDMTSEPCVDQAVK